MRSTAGFQIYYSFTTYGNAHLNQMRAHLDKLLGVVPQALSRKRVWGTSLRSFLPVSTANHLIRRIQLYQPS